MAAYPSSDAKLPEKLIWKKVGLLVTGSRNIINNNNDYDNK